MGSDVRVVTYEWTVARVNAVGPICTGGGWLCQEYREKLPILTLSL